MFDVLDIAPALGIAVLQPNKRSSNIGWTMLGVMDDDSLFAPSRHEDLHGIIVIAVGALVERALNASRMIRTIPIMPDQGWLRGAAAPTAPGAVQMVPNQAMPGPTSVWPPPPAIAAPTAPTAAAPIPAPPAKVLSEPMKIHADTNRADQSDAPDAKPELLAPAASITLGKADGTAPEAPCVSGSGYVVQVTSERSESNAQAALQALQVKYPNLLSGRQPIIRRVDLGAKGIYYRVLVSPFASVEEGGRVVQ